MIASTYEAAQAGYLETVARAEQERTAAFEAAIPSDLNRAADLHTSDPELALMHIFGIAAFDPDTFRPFGSLVDQLNAAIHESPERVPVFSVLSEVGSHPESDVQRMTSFGLLEAGRLVLKSTVRVHDSRNTSNYQKPVRNTDRRLAIVASEVVVRLGDMTRPNINRTRRGPEEYLDGEVPVYQSRQIETLDGGGGERIIGGFRLSSVKAVQADRQRQAIGWDSINEWLTDLVYRHYTLDRRAYPSDSGFRALFDTALSELTLKGSEADHIKRVHSNLFGVCQM
jgi:hypothetical protein